MTLYSSLINGVSGLNAFSRGLNNISQNISNASSSGYSRVDTRYQTTSSGGVKTHPVYTVGIGGSQTSTDVSTNLALNGPGLFAVSDRSDGNGGQFYTRSGDFAPDGDGFLRNSAGYYLLGFPSEGGAGALSPIKVSELTSGPVPTSQVSLQANVPSNAATSSDADIAAAASASSLANVQGPIQTKVVDSLGGEHTLELNFTKLDPAGGLASSFGSAGGNKYILSVSGSSAVSGANLQIDAPSLGGSQSFFEVGVEFDSNGALAGVYPTSGPVHGTGAATFGAATGAGSFGIQLDFSGGTYRPASPQNVSINLGEIGKVTSSTTSFAGSSIGVQALSQDGKQSGQLQDVSIDSKGAVVASFENGTTQNVSQVAVADFNNYSGLKQVRGNAYEVSAYSGQPFVTTPGNAGIGSISANSIEQSNVSLDDEITDMMIASAAYKANAAVVKTADEMFETLLEATDSDDRR